MSNFFSLCIEIVSRKQSKKIFSSYLDASWRHLSDIDGINLDDDAGKTEPIKESENMLAPWICPSTTDWPDEDTPWSGVSATCDLLVRSGVPAAEAADAAPKLLVSPVMT